MGINQEVDKQLWNKIFYLSIYIHIAAV